MRGDKRFSKLFLTSVFGNADIFSEDIMREIIKGKILQSMFHITDKEIDIVINNDAGKKEIMDRIFSRGKEIFS